MLGAFPPGAGPDGSHRVGNTPPAEPLSALIPISTTHLHLRDAVLLIRRNHTPGVACVAWAGKPAPKPTVWPSRGRLQHGTQQNNNVNKPCFITIPTDCTSPASCAPLVVESPPVACTPPGMAALSPFQGRTPSLLSTANAPVAKGQTRVLPGPNHPQTPTTEKNGTCRWQFLIFAGCRHAHAPR